MKHWDGRDRPEAAEPLRLSRRDRRRLARFLEPAAPPGRRRQPPHAGSMIGLALALGVLVGLALMLTPADPVSSQLLD